MKDKVGTELNLGKNYCKGYLTRSSQEANSKRLMKLFIENKIKEKEVIY